MYPNSDTPSQRKDRDSNPGYGYPYNGFRDRPDRPLRHLSVNRLQIYPFFYKHKYFSRIFLNPTRIICTFTFMKNKQNLCTIVVPIYKTVMSELEQVSFSQLIAVLGNHPISIIKPKSLDLSDLGKAHPELKFEDFDDDFFKGIPGYNRLMMSEEFYARFADSEYILIYQLDAYVFSDQLTEWCNKGYDYIGAPWLLKPMYKWWFFRFTSWIKRKYCDYTGKPNGQITWYKVGNGGLSLRRVDSHLRAVRELKDTVTHFLTVKRHHTFNEDVFFSVEVNKHGLGFKYPAWQEALGFSFDKYPALCYKLNGNKLPFGCHSWYKRKMKKFWFPIILNKGK